MAYGNSGRGVVAVQQHLRTTSATKLRLYRALHGHNPGKHKVAERRVEFGFLSVG
jgi:hypothetical protein